MFLLWVTHLTVRLGRREGSLNETADDAERNIQAAERITDSRPRALKLIHEGMPCREIARQLGTYVRTVRRLRDAARTEPDSLVGVGT
ncbi:helix-turn-helix domain-containing protein [Rhodococcus fascians]|nr:helix-turn-helix domain-containing protein [Rhodococcus fascians]MBY4399607.1 helix-turn-helix domain-containing protein [Rhodococcus fascians]MBY4409413.1 helix-turn-helix domain-containing protein [Rhodococcus fascians]MBY4424187.1 helix-turn-helix domain-containing protein [Rhodococcus fascians]MBY4463572.1 helix-turn-helix domain-containing protein [Rhodococcus fascians]